MMQSLQLAAEELGRDLTTLVSGEDYEDEILSYDLRTHRSSGVPKSVMDGHGRLYILKVIKKQLTNSSGSVPAYNINN